MPYPFTAVLNPAAPSPDAWAEDQAGRRSAEVLLNCYCREVAGPEGRVSVGPLFGRNDWPEGLRRSARGGQVLHVLLPEGPARVLAVVSHASVTGNYRYLSGFYLKAPGKPWGPTDWRSLAALLIQDLSRAHGVPPNLELLAQVQDSMRALRVILRARASGTLQGGADCVPAGTGPEATWETYLGSEQGLTCGHAFHPAPKSRLGFQDAELVRYSPEAGARFRLHWFAARRDCLREDAVGAPCGRLLEDALPPAVDADYAAVPVHPWQARWLLGRPAVRRALADGRLADLGASGPEYWATSSIRTLARPGGRYFLKLSLHVRVTNCVRKNAHYELEGALAVTRILGSLRECLAEHFPGLRVLAEPAWRSVDLDEPDAAAGREAFEGFGLILREGLDFTGPTPLLAGALLSEPHNGVLRERFIADPEAWFGAYVGLLLPPVLYAYFAHGVVFEPHLQNVLVGVRDGLPCAVTLRDFEGVKLLPKHFPAGRLPGLSARARDALWYDPERGWNRLAYCLLVNNLGEAVATLAAGDPARERRLWGAVRHHLRAYQAAFGDPASARRLNALMAGEAWPAKANLLNRFLKRPDRGATYVPVTSPLPTAEEAGPWS